MNIAISPERISRQESETFGFYGGPVSGRKEFNVYCDVPASKVVADEWPTEIVFSGFEIGNVILTGKKLVQMNVENSPVKDAYALCFTEGDPEGRMSWDHTAVLVAIKGYEPYSM